MTRNQLRALSILRDGIVRFEGRRVWPEEIRLSADFADRFIEWYYQPAKEVQSGQLVLIESKRSDGRAKDAA